jgi:hypothetical protein
MKKLTCKQKHKQKKLEEKRVDWTKLTRKKTKKQVNKGVKLTNKTTSMHNYQQGK